MSRTSREGASLVARAFASVALAAVTLAGPSASAQPAAPLSALAASVATASAGSAGAPATVDYDSTREIFHPAHALHGMVASESRLASEVGVRELQKGGNAVDAAVAVAYALAVTLPGAGNIGGGGFMVLYDAKSGRATTIDFREVAPGRASRDMYLDAQGDVVPGKSLFTPLAVGVPGTVAGLTYALEHYGSRPRAELVEPAIALAQDGFIVDEPLAFQLASARAHLGAWPASRAIFFKDGRPLQAGERLRNPDLAASLRLIAKDGAPAFYTGPIAARLVADAQAHGSLLTADDLRAYKPVERPPVRGHYRGYEIVSMPPPSSGGVHIVQILNMLSNYPLAQWGVNSAKTVHVMSEAMKRAYADRSKYLGDPDFVKVPVAGLTSQAYADELDRGIDLARATPSSEIRPGSPQPYESDQTTQFTVADGQGDVVSVTYTLNWTFGSGIVAAGTGILLNDEMDDFSAKPGVPNAFGLVGGEANSVQARKRPLSSMSPTIVLKDGKPWLATGSPGGSRIITTTLETIVDMIDFGLNPAEAAALPRFHDQWIPEELRVEKGFSPDTLALLAAMGHAVRLGPVMGRTQT
ncbi:MAG TPA: gamma-glutamyltransferase, partial [Burkholderiaceae bacterium]|nr:gamma-glutamyltransferase [Burkholderiaceae bacterium]